MADGSESWVLSFVAYAVHWLLAVPMSILAGTVPDQYLYTRFHTAATIGQIGPCSAVFGGVMGYCLNRVRRDSAATLVFIPALLLVADAVYEGAGVWTPALTTSSHLRFVVDDVLGINGKCLGDCFGSLGVTLLAPSLAYSVGAFVALRRARAAGKPRSPGGTRLR